MNELILFLARALVDKPDEVKVTEVKETERDGTIVHVFELQVAQEDLGKVIGKGGRTAHALRAVLSAAGAKAQRRVALEILD